MDGVTRAEWGTIWLDGKPYPASAVTTTELATFPQGITIGASDKNSDDILGAWIVGPDLTGGGQVWDTNEGSDLTRYWDGVCDTRRASGIALPPEVVVTRPAGVAVAAVSRPIGDVGARYYHAFDAVAYPWNEATATWGTGVSIGFPPVNKGVPWNGYVHVPQGANGYRLLSETAPGVLAVLTGSAGLTAVAFAEWNQNLYGLEHDGTLSLAVPGGAWQPAGALHSSLVPTDLVEFTDRQGAPALMVVTRSGVYTLYALANRIEKTPLKFPPHPDVGDGVAVWPPGGDLFVAAGLEVHRWTPTNVRSPLSASLSRDDGVPSQLAGRIVDLEAEQSQLFYLVAGNPVATYAETFAVEDEGDDPGVFSGVAAFTALYVNNGSGLHCVWRGEPTPDPVSWSKVSGLYGIEDSYRLWWGVGPNAYTMRLSRSYLNPREDLRRGTGRWAPAGFFETGFFDAGMASYSKLAARVVVRADRATLTETLTVSYRTSPYAGWTMLGRATSGAQVGEAAEVGDDAYEDEEIAFEIDPDGDGYPEGLAFRRIQLRVDFARDPFNPAVTPILDALILHFRKLPQKTLSHSFAVTLPTEPWGSGRDGTAMFEEIRALTAARHFPTFVHGIREGEDAEGNERAPLRVSVTQVTKSGGTGDDPSGLANVTVVEIARFDRVGVGT